MFRLLESCSSPSFDNKKTMIVSILCFVFIGGVIGISIYSAHQFYQGTSFPLTSFPLNRAFTNKSTRSINNSPESSPENLKKNKFKGDREIEVCYPVVGCFSNAEPYN